MTRKVQISPKLSTKLPIDVDGVLPEGTTGKDLASIRQMRIHLGNRPKELGELFDLAISGDAGSDVHTWTGKLENVHRIGQAMSSGHIIVQGNVGRHAGGQMRGGTLEIDGSASDFVGAEMAGGQLFVSQNVGDWAGAGYPGALAGMNRGTLIVGGDAGMGLGHAMRRGVIVVNGHCQGQIGWRMRGGTILIRGTAEPEIGTGLVRGTIILGNACLQEKELNSGVVQSCVNRTASDLGPTFRPGHCGEFEVCRLLYRYVGGMQKPFQLDLAYLSQRFQAFHGDTLELGRGEVLSAC